MTPVRCSAFLVALGGVLLAGPASGQGASALRGHDTNAPVDFSADRIELQDRADRAVLSGNVKVRQGDLSLDSSRINVAYTSASGVDINRIDASGGVTVRSPSETARGQFAVYDINRRLITMIGNVTLTRGTNVVRGGRLVIDLTSGRATMDGGGAGRGGTASATGGRVTGRCTVPQRRN